MSSCPTYILKCDVCDDTYTYIPPNLPKKLSLGHVRDKAAKLGWTHVTLPVRYGYAWSFDFCRRCTLSGAAETEKNRRLSEMRQAGKL